MKQNLTRNSISHSTKKIATRIDIKRNLLIRKTDYQAKLNLSSQFKLWATKIISFKIRISKFWVLQKVLRWVKNQNNSSKTCNKTKWNFHLISTLRTIQQGKVKARTTTKMWLKTFLMMCYLSYRSEWLTKQDRQYLILIWAHRS